jgi:hypothetical protein
MATALGVLLAGPGDLSVHGLLRRGVEGRQRTLERGARWLLAGSRWLQPRRRRMAAGVTHLLK